MRLVGIAVLGVVTSFVIPYGAAAADDVTDQLKACRTISDLTARANCYDRIVDRLPAQPAAPPATTQRPASPSATSQQPTSQQPAPTAQARPPQAPVSPVAKTPTDRFGETDLTLQQRVPEAELPPDMIVADVTAVRTDGSGYGTFTLNNGQVWRQTEGSTVRISNGARIKIKAGLLGAFYMSLENANKSFRVRRVN